VPKFSERIFSTYDFYVKYISILWTFTELRVKRFLTVYWNMYVAVSFAMMGFMCNKWTSPWMKCAKYQKENAYSKLEKWTNNTQASCIQKGISFMNPRGFILLLIA